jgi:ketosteroid isomerase-like protein
MRKTILAMAIAAASLTATAAVASDEADVLAVVNHYDDSFNRGDAKAADGDCAPVVSIVDDFAPHIWQGATACADWYAALGVFEKQQGISGDVVTLSKPWQVTITGDRAYVVDPATYTYVQKGQSVREAGVWTFALQKGAAGWRITAWAWAQL